MILGNTANIASEVQCTWKVTNPYMHFWLMKMFKPENMEWDDAKLLVWVSRSFSLC
jgi:hypothetical protein